MASVEIYGRVYFTSFTDTKQKRKSSVILNSPAKRSQESPDNDKSNHQGFKLSPEMLDKPPWKNIDTTRSATAEKLVSDEIYNGLPEHWKRIVKRYKNQYI